MPSAFGSTLGSAGFDSIAESGNENAALFFDPSTRDFRLGTDGRFVTMDPVDQEVVFSLWIRLKSIASCSTTGSDLRNIGRQGGKDFQTRIETICKTALKNLLDRNAIQILKIFVSTPSRSRTLVQVTYVNLTRKLPDRHSVTQGILF